MRPIYDTTVTREDGSPLRKYELGEVKSQRAGTRLALAFILGNMFVLLKNVLFPDDARKFGAAPFDPNAQDRRGGGEVKSNRDTGPEEQPREELAELPEVEELEELPSYLVRKRGSSTSFDLIEEERPPVRIPGFAYSSGTPLIASNDNPAIFTVNSEFSFGEFTNGAQSGGGSASGRDEDGDRDEDDDRDDDPKTPPRANRLPVVTAPIVFDSILGNQAVVFALADLLRNASDADGDALKVVGLVPSKGTTVEVKPGLFVFTPDPVSLGPVTFKYFVSDGKASVQQTATITIIEPTGVHHAGTSTSEVILGTIENDVIDAREGDDTVVALDGHDVIYGGSGNDRILGGDGNDVIYAGDGDDVVFAGGGDDVVSGGKGRDVLLGEEGEDTLFGDEDDDTLSGGEGDDTIDGGMGDDHLQGDAGNDVLIGGAGDDEFQGSVGDDWAEGGAGDDMIDAGEGNDTIAASAPSAAPDGQDCAEDAVDDGEDEYDGGSGIDTYDISATFADAVIDLFAGTAESEQIRIDVLLNIENVIGSQGHDVIIANDATNILAGGSGHDIFVFRTTASAGSGHGSRDRILDFEVGDKIDLDDISREFEDLAKAFEDDGIKKFVLIDASREFKRPGELRFKYDDDDAVTILEGNIDTDADAEFEIEISGNREFQDHDFTWNT